MVLRRPLETLRLARGQVRSPHGATSPATKDSGISPPRRCCWWARTAMSMRRGQLRASHGTLSGWSRSTRPSRSGSRMMTSQSMDVPQQVATDLRRNERRWRIGPSAASASPRPSGRRAAAAAVPLASRRRGPSRTGGRWARPPAAARPRRSRSREGPWPAAPGAQKVLRAGRLRRRNGEALGSMSRSSGSWRWGSRPTRPEPLWPPPVATWSGPSALRLRIRRLMTREASVNGNSRATKVGCPSIVRPMLRSGRRSAKARSLASSVSPATATWSTSSA
mmetsp:Transcript_48602/g.141594  ORF Transcript_48602/g.141594 Transcript_48602/m.141594 type:complete len:279 (-) Transcript_48602:80-916(-)